MLMMMAPKRAFQKPSTWNGGIIWDTKSRRRALTTKINSPIVIMINGRLKRSKNGLTKALMIPKSSDAPSRASTPEQVIPGRIRSATKTAMVVTIHRIKKALTIFNLIHEAFF
jgi:hypothetical protein